jgi:hypothetical protein
MLLLLYHWRKIGGRVGPRSHLDDMEKCKFFTLLGLVQHAAIHYIDK